MIDFEDIKQKDEPEKNNFNWVENKPTEQEFNDQWKTDFYMPVPKEHIGLKEVVRRLANHMAELFNNDFYFDVYDLRWDMEIRGKWEVKGREFMASWRIASHQVEEMGVVHVYEYVKRAFEHYYKESVEGKI